jgi:hypothetical protein
MKNLTLALALYAALSAPVAAQAVSPAKAEMCHATAALAASLMTSRQAGVDLSDVLRIADADPLIRDIMREMAVAAWSETRYSTPAYRQRAVEDFRDRMHILCLRA